MSLFDCGKELYNQIETAYHKKKRTTMRLEIPSYEKEYLEFDEVLRKFKMQMEWLSRL